MTRPGIRSLTALGLAATLSLAPALLSAQSAENAMKARKGQFQIMQLNIALLGGMARGNIEYDAEAATVAAQNLAAVGMVNQAFNWPEGSDNESVEGTRALPAIWEDNDAFLAEWTAFGAAASAIVDSVGGGREALGPALGQVGSTCQSCHESFRAPNN